MNRRDRILDIFYKNIIPEAQVGRINCLNYYNVVFETRITQEDKYYESLIDEEGLLVPVLMIKNKDLFDELLVEYVNKALEFYENENFDEEILDDKMYDDNYRICQEKVILAMLFANATSDDYENPISFLKRRIEFFDNQPFIDMELGYSEILKSNLTVSIKKDIINNETPYQFCLSCYSDNGDEFVFPKIKFGIYDNDVYVYAIQNDRVNEGIFSKKINRLLYKVGEGCNLDNDLKDITHSFLVSLNVFMACFNSLGYSNIIVPPLLVSRWNAKMMANILKIKRKNLSDSESVKLMDEQIRIQYNLTNKFIRTFLRYEHHYNNIDILNYPYMVGTNLVMRFNDKNVECNNKLLLETASLVRCAFDRNIGFKR